MLGLDPAPRRRALRGAGRADAPGGRDLPPGAPARDPPPVRRVLPRPARPGRAPRAGRPGRRGAGPATASCRAASGSASGSRWRSSAGPSSSSSTSRRPGMDPAAKAVDARAHRRRSASGGVTVLAHDARAGRRRAARRPGRDPRPRPDRRRRVARRARRRRRPHGSASASAGRWPRRTGPPSRPRLAGRAAVDARTAAGSRRTAALGRYRLDGIATRAAAPRRARGLVRRARHPDRRAADRRGDPRGALPRAHRRAAAERDDGDAP